MKKYLKSLIINFLVIIPKPLYDYCKNRFSKTIRLQADKKRLRRFGVKLSKSPEKYYKKIFSNYRIMEISEGSFSYKYFNVCYLNNMIDLILYALYEGCIPVIKVNDDNPKYNKWSWYFEQPAKILGADKEFLSKCEVIKCDYKDSYFKITFEDGFYPYSDNFPIWQWLNKTFVVFNEETSKYINEEKERLLSNNTLGVLLRGTDYTALKPLGHPIQPEIGEVIQYIKKYVDKKGYEKIYVATEEKRLFDLVVQEFGEKNVLSNKRTYYDEIYYSNKHNYIGEVKFDRKNDNYLKGLEYLSSISILSSCNGIVSGNCGGCLYALLNAEGYEDIYVFNKGLY